MPKSLDRILERIEAAKLNKQSPIVIFDIDDTIIDCRHRKLKVFQDFIKQENISQNYSQQSEALAEASIEDIHYRVHDCMNHLNIDDQKFIEELFEFWLARYFTHDYLIQDKSFHGAEDFVKRCHSAGAHVVYLTGRDEPGMASGTHHMLETLNFPWKVGGTSLILKPEAKLSDFDYKAEALKKIKSMGTVVASLENELKNLNQMAVEFPGALMFWRKTLFLPNPPEPHTAVEELLSFS